MKVGMPVMYYLDGLRYGIIRRIPVRGERKGWMRIEVPVDRWKWDADRREWVSRARETVWIPARDVRPVNA